MLVSLAVALLTGPCYGKQESSIRLLQGVSLFLKFLGGGLRHVTVMASYELQSTSTATRRDTSHH